MEFIIRSYKKDEFTNAIQNICDDLKMNMGQLQFDFDDSDTITVHVQDNVIERMSEAQLNELRSIK